MNTIARIVFAFCLGCWCALALNCALTQKVTAPIISTVKDCADQTTHAVAAGILNDVSQVLVCNATSAESLPACVVDELKAIAKANGWPAVDCALSEIQQKASANVAASEDTTENLRARRATAAIAWRNPDAGAP